MARMSNGTNHVIFDLDGTLIDSVEGIAASALYAARKVTPNLELHDFKAHIGPPISEIFSRTLGIDPSQTFLLERLESNFRQHYNRVGWKKSVAFPGVFMTLKLLREKGFQCHILTNKPFKPTSAILLRLRLRPFFTTVLSPDSSIFQFSRKSDGAIFLRQALRPVGTTLFLVGDSIDDYKAARAASLRFIGVRYGYGKIHLIPNLRCAATISKFSELLSIL